MISDQSVESYILVGYVLIGVFMALDLGVTSGAILSGDFVEKNPLLVVDGHPSPFVNQWEIIGKLLLSKIVISVIVVSAIEGIKHAGGLFGFDKNISTSYRNRNTQTIRSMIMKTQTNNLKQRKNSNENAVSPVIGVLLMVMITVVLAGVIAPAFVFGMSGTIGNQKIVAATAHQTEGNSIYVTYQGGQDSGKLVNLSVTIDSVEQEPIGEVDGILKVGSSAKYTGDYEGSNRVLVVGTFTDGSSQIVLDTWV